MNEERAKKTKRSFGLNDLTCSLRNRPEMKYAALMKTKSKLKGSPGISKMRPFILIGKCQNLSTMAAPAVRIKNTSKTLR
jgi:hypothetical protein